MLNTSTQELGSKYVRSGISDAKSVTEDMRSVDDTTPKPNLAQAEDDATL